MDNLDIFFLVSLFCQSGGLVILLLRIVDLTRELRDVKRSVDDKCNRANERAWDALFKVTALASEQGYEWEEHKVNKWSKSEIKADTK
jgi:hypothetical protein